MATKILIINPALPYEGLMYEREIPVHLVYLANFLREKLIPTPAIEVLDIDLERKSDPTLDSLNHGHVERLIKDIIDRAFTIGRDDKLFVLISCYFTFQYVSARVLLESIRALRTSRSVDVHEVIIGGYHPTVLPEDFDGLGVDVLIQGEGETAIYNVISRENGHPQARSPRRVQGSIIEDLDTLPVIDFTVYEKYLPFYSHLSVVLSRGCPYNCYFCVEKKYKAFKRDQAHSWRAYSPERATVEIRRAIEASDNSLGKGRDNAIGFYDPIFGINDEWLRHVLQRLKEMDSGYRFWAETRVDAFKLQNLPDIKRANIMYMFGLESASPMILSLMNKTNDPRGYLTRLEKILKRTREAAYGPCVLNLVLNFPGETPSSLRETFSYLNRLADTGAMFVTGSNLYHFMPGDTVFANVDAWEHRHGTRIHCKDWWKCGETATAGYVLDASSALSIEEGISMVYGGMKELCEHMMLREEAIPKKLAMIKKIASEGKARKDRLETAARLLGPDLCRAGTI